LEKVVVFAIIALLIISTAAVAQNYLAEKPEQTEKCHVGVAFCGNTTAEAELLIDKTKDYTNLFVLQSGLISKNETAINIVCDYAVASGLDFIVFLGWFDFAQPWQIPWLDYAKERWGDRFLGLYLYDEAGGIQVDYNWTQMFYRIKAFDPSFFDEVIAPYFQENLNQTVIRDYDAAQKRFNDYIVNWVRINELTDRNITAFTADYALYWFDYLSGYDTVFAELGWNLSTPEQIGLCRGAANAQNKDWGAIIVWNDHDPIDINKGTYKTGLEMLQDMMVAYETGAKYVVIFNYPTDPPGNPYGILTEEHFAAMQQFWNYIHKHPEDYGKSQAQAALVLPKNYGWGLRHPDDRIWGYWGPDEYSPQIWNLTQTLLDKYGLSLDIVYDDPAFPIEGKYAQIYYWNQTSIPN
jgi:hypothetical protein